MLEETKGWNALESSNDLRVLELEREILAESLGVDVDSLPMIAEDDDDDDDNHDIIVLTA